MKYFTMRGWIADQDLDADPAATWAAVDAYAAYLDEVRSRLPAEFRRMLETVCIHDARLLELVVDVPGGRVALTLDAGDVTMREPRRVRLCYEGVRELRIPEDPPVGFAGVGFGDLGNDEVEVLGDADGFEHRILFERGIEFVVRFSDFRLEVLPASPDHRPTRKPPSR